MWDGRGLGSVGWECGVDRDVDGTCWVWVVGMVSVVGGECGVGVAGEGGG